MHRVLINDQNDELLYTVQELMRAKKPVTFSETVVNALKIAKKKLSKKEASHGK